MKTTQIKNLTGVLLLAWAGATASGQAPVIASFGQNGVLVCTNLLPGTTSSVEWASSVLGPWTNTWAGLDAVTADTNGAIRVSVPMFYRVRGTPRPTDPPAPASMVLIPAGPFTMGNTWPSDGENAPFPASYELPLHTNQISAFYMDKFKVTKALWDEVLVWANTNGYDLGTIGDGHATNHPIQTVNWYDVVKWCNARSEKEGRRPAYYTSADLTTVYRTGQIDVQNDWVKWGAGYRLPTEAEWEKAARGGTSGQRFPWGNTISWSQANYQSGGGEPYDVNPTPGSNPTFYDGIDPRTNPVGYFAPNGYGLYDMAGNLYEWTWDGFGFYTGSPATDPRGIAGAPSVRVIRGGSWGNYAYYCRSAYRISLYPGYRYFTVGFRVVLSPGQ